MLRVIPVRSSSLSPDVPLPLHRQALSWEAAMPAPCPPGPVARGSPWAPAGADTGQS